jgi:recombination protein RecA
MAKSKKEEKLDVNKIANNMLDNLNKKFGKKVVYNLGAGEDPAKINRWYSTRSMLLDGIFSGKIIGGGGPGGRFVEIAGPESIGKSHICYQMARDIQEAGGIVLYIDTERATDVRNLINLGVNINERFFYAKVDSVEGVFETADEFLKELAPYWKKIPIGIFWDSVGGIGSRIERDMAFDDVQRPGLNAKQITFGFRKIIPAVDESEAIFVIVNQEYDILDAGRYDSKKTETKGGKALKYFSTIRLGLKKVTDVYPNDMDRNAARAAGIRPNGIRVRATTNKNKVAAPNRNVEIDIIFGVGLKEHISIWEMLVKAKELTVGNKIYSFSGGAWRSISIADAKTGEVSVEAKFRKSGTEEAIEKHREDLKPCVDYLMKDFMVMTEADKAHMKIEEEVPEEEVLEDIE